VCRLYSTDSTDSLRTQKQKSTDLNEVLIILMEQKEMDVEIVKKLKCNEVARVTHQPQLKRRDKDER
jgi:stalled ribosome rescue protein Dom34